MTYFLTQPQETSDLLSKFGGNVAKQKVRSVQEKKKVKLNYVEKKEGEIEQKKTQKNQKLSKNPKIPKNFKKSQKFTFFSSIFILGGRDSTRAPVSESRGGTLSVTHGRSPEILVSNIGFLSRICQHGLSAFINGQCVNLCS